MTTPDTRAATEARQDESKAQERAVWGLGDYHRFAKATVWPVGPVLVDACRIGPSQRVLDLATGSGNVALRAAQAGADVVASDLTSANFDAGRREAAALGVSLEWVEADAEDLPFADDEFDVVTSSFGVMFAPHHEVVADEMTRVCRPGGTIGLASFTPTGLGGEFFSVLTPYLPPLPPDVQPPLLWGEENHARTLLEPRVDQLTMSRREYTEHAQTPEGYVELFTQTFGPVVALLDGMADRPDRAADLRDDLYDFAHRANRGSPAGPAEYPYQYLLVTARLGP